jgi:hypothetical protein
MSAVAYVADADCAADQIGGYRMSRDHTAITVCDDSPA